MPRRADELYLELAVEQGLIGPRDRAEVLSEIARSEAQGEPVKARALLLELGFVDEGVARRLKDQVRQRLVAEAAAPPPGQRVGDFELQDELGAGASGTVYRARHVRLNRLVALKVLDLDRKRTTTDPVRFLGEARAAMRLSHPNVVQLLDVGCAGDTYYLAMELVDGKTVKELVQRRGRLDEAAAIEIAIQCVAALQHAHESSIVHRDVKPANVMVTREGQAKLLDLGLARAVDMQGGVTAEGRVLGTPYYMAPEQATDKGVDYRADLYALGTTLFHMVTGERPYRGDSPYEILSQHMRAPIPDARDVEPRVSEGLARIVKKLMAKRPADRYQSHAALRSDLEGLLSGLMPALDGGPVPSGLPHVRERPTAPTARRGRRAAADGGDTGSLFGRQLGALALAACLLAAAGVVFLRSGRDAPPRVAVTPVTSPVTSDDRRDRDARTPPPDAPPPSPDRQAADALAEVDRAALGPRERAATLRALARRFPATTAGRQAAAEAERLFAHLGEAALERAAATGRELEELVRRGELYAAWAGYDELARTTADLSPDAAASARERAAELRGQLDAALVEVQAEALDLAARGEREAAAATLRRAAALVGEAERAALFARADQLEGAAPRREEGQTDAERARELETELAALPGALAELVSAGRVADALARARELEGRCTADARGRCARHVAALEAVAALDGLTRTALERSLGQDVSLARRRGAPLEGTLLRLEGDVLTVRLSARAEVACHLADLVEDDLLALARRVHGARHEGYLRGVAALKLYRRDPDARAALARAEEARVPGAADLQAIAAELLPPPREDEVHAYVTPEGDDPAPTTAVPDAAEPAPATSGGGSSSAAELASLYGEARGLFPEAGAVGFTGTALQLVYDFQVLRAFGPSDWRQTGGRAYPTPAGQVERAGLILEGRGGRAELVAPVAGDFTVRIRFTSQMLGRTARVALTADAADARRYACELGQLVERLPRGGGRANGDSCVALVRAQRVHVLELAREGGALVTRFDNAVVGRLEPEQDLGVTRLGLEWDRAALNLLTVEVTACPDAAWVEARLEAGR